MRVAHIWKSFWPLSYKIQCEILLVKCLKFERSQKSRYYRMITVSRSQKEHIFKKEDRTKKVRHSKIKESFVLSLDCGADWKAPVQFYNIFYFEFPHLSVCVSLTVSTVSLSLCDPDKIVLQILRLLCSDVKFQTSFPLLQWSVCGDKSGAAAICMDLHSILSLGILSSHILYLYVTYASLLLAKGGLVRHCYCCLHKAHISPPLADVVTPRHSHVLISETFPRY